MRKTLKFIAMLVGLSLCAGGVYRYFQGGIARSAPGIYLAEGGLGYLVIEKNGGALRVAEPDGLPDTDGRERYFSGALAVQLLGERLRLTGDWDQETMSDLGLDPALNKGRGWIMDFVRSPEQRGDFDLVGYREPQDIRPSDTNPKPPEPPASVSCASYLHLVNDARIPLYFAAQRRDRDPARALSIARELLAAHPADLHARSLYMEALLKAEDFGEFRSRLGEWRKEWADSANLYLKRLPGLADYTLQSKALTDSGGNAYVRLEKLIRCGDMEDLKSRENLAAWIDHPPDLLECTGFMYPPAELNPARMAKNNFLAEQVFAKVTRMASAFLMLQGKRPDALRVLEAGFKLGVWRSRNGVLIDRLVGIAITQVQLSGLTLYALNACETEEELRSAAGVLDQSKDMPERFQEEGFGLFLSPPLEIMAPVANMPEGDERYRHAVTRMRLLRAGIAARRRLIAEGSYPAKPGDFDAWMTGGLPRDPFGDGAVRFEVRSDELVLRSVGPDGVDELGAIEYDPTNGIQGQGSHSGGDVILRVPKERQYPFPREGTKASSPDDLRRQFPNGLPIDGFARTRNRPLGISAGPPLRVYSFGPDNDESSAAERGVGDAYQVEVMYDPTNGLTSSGDLFVEIPAP